MKKNLYSFLFASLIGTAAFGQDGYVTVNSANDAVRLGNQVWLRQNVGSTAPIGQTNVSPQTAKNVGNYYSWGYNKVLYNANTYPTYPSTVTGTANPDKTAWNRGTTYVPVKTASDPCPNGFRVPTRTEYEILMAYATQNWDTSWTGAFQESLNLKSPTRPTAMLTFPLGGYIENLQYKTPFTGFGKSSSGVVYGKYVTSSPLDNNNYYNVFQFSIRDYGSSSEASMLINNELRGNNCKCIEEGPVANYSTDLYVTKNSSDGTSTYIAGSTVSYTVTAGNNGPVYVSGATVNDLVPTGIPAANVTWTVTNIYGGTGGTTSQAGANTTRTGVLSDVVDLPVGGYVTYTVKVNVPLGFNTDLVNTATVAVPSNAVVTDSNTGNNTATVTKHPEATSIAACAPKIFLSQSAGSSTGFTTLYQLDNSTNPFSTVTLGTDNSSAYNAIGYNSADGYIYGLSQAGAITAGNLLRIDPQTGAVLDLGAISGLPPAFYRSGEIDSRGNYYVFTGTAANSIYKVDLTQRSATPIGLSRSVTCSDLAYNVNTGLLYGVQVGTGEGSGVQLFSINPIDGTVTDIGVPQLPGNVFGAMYGDASGRIFGAQNNGGFYQFNLTTGQRTLISATAGSEYNDGAHCLNDEILFVATPKVTIDDGKDSYSRTSDNVYTVTVTNDGPFGIDDISVLVPLPSGIPAANVSYTAATSGGANAGAISGHGAINDVVGLPIGGKVVYTVTVSIPDTYPADQYLVYAANLALSSTSSLAGPQSVLYAEDIDSDNGDGGTVTPVTWSSFSTAKVNTSAVLRWTTASEVNNAGFSVERSADGKEWSVIGHVPSKATGGNSGFALDYDYTDASPLSGSNLYRIKQTDMDGRYDYSVVRTLTFEMLGSFRVYPNPATSTISVADVPVGTQLRIVGMDGKVCQTATVTGLPQNVNVSSLSSGLYFVQALQGGKAVSVVKFVKK